MAPKRNPYYAGPPSDHFDGLRFFTPGHRVVNCTSDFFKWQFSGERVKWPDSVANPPAPPPPQKVASPDLSVTFIGHATVLIQTAGLNILTDPFFSGRTSPVQFIGPKRVRPPGLALKDLPRIDVIYVSHNHFDHMDMPVLRQLHDRHKPRIITPLGNAAILKQTRRTLDVVEADWGDTVPLASDSRLTLAPALHWSKRTFHDRNMALWAACVIEAPGGPVYFAADTGYGDGRHFRDVHERFGTPRLALIPVGAYEPRWFMKAQHINPEEAVRAYHDLGSPLSLGIHHSTVQLTDEAIDAPLQDLEAARKAKGVSGDRFRTIEVGHSWDIPALAKGRCDMVAERQQDTAGSA